MSVINKGGTGEDEPAGAQFRRVPLGRVRAPAPGPGAPPHPGRPVGVPGAAARLREQEAHPLVLQGTLPRIQARDVTSYYMAKRLREIRQMTNI